MYSDPMFWGYQANDERRRKRAIVRACEILHKKPSDPEVQELADELIKLERS